MVAEGSPATGFEPICCGPYQPDTYQLCFTLALVAFQNTSMTPLACAAAGSICDLVPRHLIRNASWCVADRGLVGG